MQEAVKQSKSTEAKQKAQTDRAKDGTAAPRRKFASRRRRDSLAGDAGFSFSQ